MCQETQVTQHVELVGVQHHSEVIGHQIAGPAVVGAVAPAAVGAVAPAFVGAVAPAVVGAVAGPVVAPALAAPIPARAIPAGLVGTIDPRFAAAQRQFGLVLPEAGVETPASTIKLQAAPVGQHQFTTLVKREADADAEPEADADAEAHLLLGAAPVALGHAPVAIAPRCGVQVERVCNKVPVQVPRTVQVPKCVPVPKTHCVDTTRVVAGPPACKDVPRKVCHPVAKQVPFEVPVQQCKQVPSQACHDVPHKVARQVCKTAYVAALDVTTAVAHHGHHAHHGYAHHGHHAVAVPAVVEHVAAPAPVSASGNVVHHGPGATSYQHIQMGH